MLDLAGPGDLVCNLRLFVRYFVQRSEETFHLPHITEKRVRDEIIRLYDSLSPGVDGISIRQIFDSLPLFCSLLASLFKAIIQAGVYLSKWKKTLIKHIPEIPSKASDMRPIALQNMHSKIFDGISVDEILSFFETRRFFVNEQFGF